MTNEKLQVMTRVQAFRHHAQDIVECIRRATQHGRVELRADPVAMHLYADDYALTLNQLRNLADRYGLEFSEHLDRSTREWVYTLERRVKL